MIILYHPEGIPEADKWKDQLEQMNAAHLLVKSEQGAPYLKEGKREVKGVAAIDAFLAEYKTFMSSWNQDRCDMWFFDE
ncbi:MAG: hypothetical protein HEP71_34380 [Roseivirga sp.]|nr:hypothetical protein [Roseivirga sp.]